MTELLNCPCGGEAELYDSNSDGERNRKVVVRCTEVFCVWKMSGDVFDGDFKKAVKAVTGMWNAARATTEREKELLATVESMKGTNLALGAKAKGLEFDNKALVYALERLIRDVKFNGGSKIIAASIEVVEQVLSQHKEND